MLVAVLAHPRLMRGVMMVAVNVEQRSVSVPVKVEVSRVPAVQQPEREQHNEPSDQRLRATLNRLGQKTAEEHYRHAEQKERRGVSQTPGQTEHCGSPDSTLPLIQQQGGDRGEMVRIESVTQPEYQRNNQWEIHRDIIPCTRSKITDMARSRWIDSRP